MPRHRELCSIQRIRARQCRDVVLFLVANASVRVTHWFRKARSMLPKKTRHSIGYNQTSSNYPLAPDPSAGALSCIAWANSATTFTAYNIHAPTRLRRVIISVMASVRRRRAYPSRGGPGALCWDHDACVEVVLFYTSSTNNSHETAM